MGPYTADNLREKRYVYILLLRFISIILMFSYYFNSYNRMKDYAAVAGHLGVTHLMVVSQTQHNVILRLARIPEGPTLHFRVNQYSLSRQVRASQRRPYDSLAACK